MNVWNSYGPTVARVHDLPGRELRPKSITIDIHSHVAVPAAAEFVKPYLDPMKNALVLHATDETRALNSKQEADIRPRITGYDQRLADLDAMGIDFQLVMPPPPQCYYTVPIQIAVRAAQIVNDGIAEYVAGKPERFAGLGSVPMPDGNEAALELDRCVRKLGLKGVQILTNVNGLELSDPTFAPFWKKAEELRALVRAASARLRRRQAALALLLQQHHRQSARYYHRAALPDLRRRTGAASGAEDPRRARRRLSRRLFRPHRPRLGRALRRPWRPAVSAHELPARKSISTRWCSRRISLPSWYASMAPTASSWAPTIHSTWRTAIRSATSPRRDLTMRQSLPSPAAMRRSCSDFRAQPNCHIAPRLRGFLKC